MATGGHFDEVLVFYDEDGRQIVNAAGDVEADGDLKEICVWVVQRNPDPPGNDIAMTEMTTTLTEVERPEFDVDRDTGRWGLPVGHVAVRTVAGVFEESYANLRLVAGGAIAMAIGLFTDNRTNQHKTLLWAQTVVLQSGSKPARPSQRL